MTFGSTPSASDEATLAGAETGARTWDGDALERGSVIGRYVVLDRLGMGAMGAVFAAYDPELDRKVAIKLLHANGREDTDGEARLLREAQALAKLSHPNIVGVHDVGTTGGRVWIAMELVAGATLQAWLRERQRPWRDVLGAFLGAGRGLEAAHRAGIVHRDFKPDNVMVGADGRSRVMDFGLARPTAKREESAESPCTTGDEARTRDGMSGTPAYMSPEQFAGGDVDARADQFGFCVSLWQGLYGERPFHGDSLASLARAVVAGELREPHRRGIPPWLQRALRRGLASDRDARWASMDALVFALERGQSRARMQRVLAGVGATVAVAIAVAVVHGLDQRRRVAACESEGATIDEVWNDDARARVRAALLATGASYAEVTADRVEPWIDEHAAGWRDARTEACLDAEVREQWDRDTYERSSWCLDERRTQLEALVGELVRGDAQVLQRAVKAAAELDRIAPCRDAAYLSRLPAVPEAQREELRSVRADLVRAAGLRDMGRHADAHLLVTAAGKRAETLAWPPLVAAAATVEAAVLAAGGDYVEAESTGGRAYFTAAQHGAWEIAAAAAMQLASVVGDQQSRHADGLVWSRHAEVALSHSVDHAGLREASRLEVVAIVHHRSGDYAQSIALHERAIAIVEEALGPTHPALANNLNNLANACYEAGDFARAGALFERTLAIDEASLGANHPDVANTMSNLGGVHFATGDYAKARESFERAIPIFEAALGPEHPGLAQILNNLANVHRVTGGAARALALGERSLAIYENALGPEHPGVAMALINLGNLHSGQGRYPEARAALERALAINEKALGPDHPDVGLTMNNLANVYMGSGDRVRAREMFERGLAIREKALGPDHPEVAMSLNNVAVVLYESKEYAKARPLAERAVAIAEAALGNAHPDLALTLFTLADVCTAMGEHEHARDLLARAMGIYDGLEGTQTNEAETRAALEKAEARLAPLRRKSPRKHTPE